MRWVKSVPWMVALVMTVLVALAVPAMAVTDDAGTTTPPSAQTTDPTPTDASTPPGATSDASTTTDPTTATPGPTDPESSPDPSTTGTDDAATEPTTSPTTTTTPGTSTDSSASTSDPSSRSTTPATTATTVSQSAGVTTVGTSVANTGINVVTSTASSGPAGASASTATATITTDAASATGGATNNVIAQTASAIVTDSAKVTIYQLALVLNVGLALAQSGGNAASAVPSDSQDLASISTGNAAATGLQASTAVTQVVNLLDTDETTIQSVSVVNVGLGAANTGGNLAIVNHTPGAPAAAIAIQWQPASAAVDTGTATAVGLASNTTIVQVAIGTASDDGTIHISQRAIVLNFGAALALSGDNGADAANQAFVSAVVRALVAALVGDPFGASALDPGSSPISGSSIFTGSSTAVGDSSTTSIQQTAVGSVTGDHSVDASQTAAVANVGVALANSGANNAGGSGSNELAATSTDPAVDQIVQSILALIGAPGDEASWYTTLDVGTALLQSFGELHTVDTMVSPEDGMATTAGATIRQVTGIVNLLFAFAHSGNNQATTSTDQQNGTTDPADPPLESASVRSSTIGASDVSASADGPVSLATTLSIVTGDATAVGSHSTVKVCQLINAPQTICDPPSDPGTGPTTTTPAVQAEAVVRPVAAVGSAPSVLAFTGAGPLGLELLLAGLLIVLGLGLLLAVQLRRQRVC